MPIVTDTLSLTTLNLMHIDFLLRKFYSNKNSRVGDKTFIQKLPLEELKNPKIVPSVYYLLK